MTKRLLPATRIVMVLLCLMYFMTYLDRVNVSSAAAGFGKEFGLNSTQIGLVFSAFAYPYLIFQVMGGWLSDRFGAKRTLIACGLVWATATVLTGLSIGLMSILAARLLLGLGEGATLPAASTAMSRWVPKEKRGYAQGVTHAAARIGNAVAPAVVVAVMTTYGWRESFYVCAAISFLWVLVWALAFTEFPVNHPRITPEELQELSDNAHGTKPPPQIPWRRLTRRILPVTAVYFCYGWTLWLYLNWLPSYFVHEYKLDLKGSAVFSMLVFLAGVGGDYLGGVISDRILETTHDLRRARRDFVVVSFLASFLCMLPVFLTHNLTLIVISLAGAFFFAELTIGPMWAIPMDVAPRYSGTAAGLMNTGSAVAAVLSPIAFGYIVDGTGNWQLPFIGSLGLLLLGAGIAFTMHPERAFEPESTATLGS